MTIQRPQMQKKKTHGSIRSLLFGSAFVPMNMKMVQRYGPITAFVLANLADKDEFFEHNKKNYDGWFYQTNEQQTQRLNITLRELQKAKKELIKDKILIIEVFGIPSKEWFNLDYTRLEYYLYCEMSDIPDKSKLENDLNEDDNNHLEGTPLCTLGYAEPRTLEKMECRHTIGEDEQCIQNNTKQHIQDNINDDSLCTLGYAEPRTLAYADPRTLNTNKNKENNNNKVKDRTALAKEKNNNPIHLSLARHLSKTIRSKKKIKHTSNQLKQWTIPIKKLADDILIGSHEENIIRIQKVLDWYALHIGDPYVPTIESGKALLEKFDRLENAIERDKIDNEPKEIANAFAAKPGKYNNLKTIKIGK